MATKHGDDDGEVELRFLVSRRRLRLVLCCFCCGRNAKMCLAEILCARQPGWISVYLHNQAGIESTHQAKAGARHLK